jgi:hypothetical protein
VVVPCPALALVAKAEVCPREGVNPPEADKPLPYIRFRVP